MAIFDCEGAPFRGVYGNPECSCVSTINTGTHIGQCQTPDANEMYFCYVEKGACCEAESKTLANYCVNYSLCQSYDDDKKQSVIRPTPYVIPIYF